VRYIFLLPAFDGMWHTYPIVRVNLKFADLGEYGYGVAILSESKYGFSCQGNVLRISLLNGT
jgi:alpha-mannosidase